MALRYNRKRRDDDIDYYFTDVSSLAKVHWYKRAKRAGL